MDFELQGPKGGLWLSDLYALRWEHQEKVCMRTTLTDTVIHKTLISGTLTVGATLTTTSQIFIVIAG